MDDDALRISDDLHARRAFDEFDFVTVRGIDENEAAAGRGCGRAVRDLESLWRRVDAMVSSRLST